MAPCGDLKGGFEKEQERGREMLPDITAMLLYQSWKERKSEAGGGKEGRKERERIEPHTGFSPLVLTPA